MIAAIVISLVYAWMLDYAQLLITEKNYSSKFNGRGSIKSVLNGTAVSPTQYRVAVPFLYWLFPFYEPLKILLMAFGLFSIWFMMTVVYGDYAMTGLLLTGAFYVANFQFDYAEQYLELGLWALFLTALYQSNLILIGLVAFFASLTRETAVFLPLAALLSYGISYEALVAFAPIVIVSVLLRVRYGLKVNYLKYGTRLRSGREIKGVWHLKYNLEDMRKALKWIMHPVWYAIFMVALVCVGIAWGIYPKELQYASFVGIPFIIVLLCRAMLREGVRIMLPLLVFVIPTLSRWISEI